MTDKSKIKKMALGLRCCLMSAQTHLCPDQCPYSGQSVDCMDAMLRDLREYIMELEHKARARRRRARRR